MVDVELLTTSEIGTLITNASGLGQLQLIYLRMLILGYLLYMLHGMEMSMFSEL